MTSIRSGLNARGWNGSAFAGKIKERKAALTRPISQPNTRARQEDIAAATSTGARYHATGGAHITSDDMFKSIEVGKRNAEAAQLEKEKKSRLEKMELEEECHGILYQLAEDDKDPNGKQLKRLLKWQEKKSTRVAEDLLVWNAICAEHEAYGTIDEIISALPSVKRWMQADEERLIWLRTAEEDMADTALGRKQAHEKRNLLMAARNMTADEQAEVLAAFSEANASQVIAEENA